MCEENKKNLGKIATDKESDAMLTLNKPKQATIINAGKTKSFFEEMYNNKATKSYWDECSKTSKIIDSSSMSILKKKCNSEHK